MLTVMMRIIRVVGCLNMRVCNPDILRLFAQDGSDRVAARK